MIFDDIFDDFGQNLASGGASEACWAPSWDPGGSKTNFLMSFGGSRVSFWSPGGTLGGVMGQLWTQNASKMPPKPQNLKKNDLGNDVEQKSSKNKVPDMIFQ